MDPNRQQTFSTPANSKNKIYFMWDFLLRTFQFISARVDPRSPHSSQMWIDVITRTAMAQDLTLDTTGKLEAMNASVNYYDDEGVDFGNEIKELARTLLPLPEACVCGATQTEDGGVLLRCKKCKDQRYCSTQCQQLHWKVHKKGCGKA
jgi:hypothetical protein